MISCKVGLDRGCARPITEAHGRAYAPHSLLCGRKQEIRFNFLLIMMYLLKEMCAKWMDGTTVENKQCFSQQKNLCMSHHNWMMACWRVLFEELSPHQHSKRHHGTEVAIHWRLDLSKVLAGVQYFHAHYLLSFLLLLCHLPIVQSELEHNPLLWMFLHEHLWQEPLKVQPDILQPPPSHSTPKTNTSTKAKPTYHFISYTHWGQTDQQDVVETVSGFLNVMHGGFCAEFECTHHLMPPIIWYVKIILQCQQCLHCWWGHASLQKTTVHQHLSQTLPPPHKRLLT